MYNDNNHYSNLEVLSPKEGLTIGNLFFDLYRPYKNYKPRELTAHSEKDKLVLKMQELGFAINDLCLYLTMYPDDKKCYDYYKECIIEYGEVRKEYVEKYGPLGVSEDLKGSYEWYQGPWPWEGHNV